MRILNICLILIFCRNHCFNYFDLYHVWSAILRKGFLSIFIPFTLLGPMYGQEKLPIHLSKSKIQWLGEYTFFFGGHEGTIDLNEGYITRNGDLITGGTFAIDMNTITNTDIKKEDSNQSLVDHLKGSDFFDVQNFPFANLKITDVSYENETRLKIFADLTIRGITEPIDFRAEYLHELSQIKAKFKIDRRRWNINYTSKFRNSAISDAIGFIVELSF